MCSKKLYLEVHSGLLVLLAIRMQTRWGPYGAKTVHIYPDCPYKLKLSNRLCHNYNTELDMSLKQMAATLTKILKTVHVVTLFVQKENLM